MRWTPGGQSPDIEDRRSQSGYGGFGGPGMGGGGFGGFGGPGFGGRRIGIGGILFLIILSLIIRHFSGPSGQTGQPYRQAPTGQYQPYGNASRDAQEAREVQFVSFVLDDVQNTWDQSLQAQTGVPYRHAKLVLFRDYTQSGCGMAQSATGPFYCPADEKVYIDLGFYQELADRFGAPGEFAQAYVLGHEIGHHVQKMLGIEQKVRRLQLSEPSLKNPLSVKMELQADCLSGVWAHSTKQRNIIDEADIAAGLQAAAAVGDDRMQKMAQGHVSPESFTHGSSEQRMEWFRRGLDSGQISSCNTFAQ
jgi:predicted metalloprotease